MTDVTITLTLSEYQAHQILETSAFEWRDLNGELCDGLQPLSVREAYRALTAATRRALGGQQ